MRGTRRPRHQQDTNSNPADNSSNGPSAGSRLRDALARKQAGDDQQKQADEDNAKSAFRNTLSSWFNGIAAKLPQSVKDITDALDGGSSASTDLSFSAADSISLRGVSGENLETLAGFQTLDKTCKDLDIQCSVAAGRNGYGRKSTAGQEYLHVNIDVSQPYQPLSVEKPRPHGPRFR